MEGNPVLAIVIPVYNEEKNITGLLRDWKLVFERTMVPYRIILIDDGSKDNCLSMLRAMEEEDPALAVHTQSNAGHGPSILRGYVMALNAEWVFQIDSDHQLDTAAFLKLWENKDQHDLLIAERVKKNASSFRQCISWTSRLFVHLLYGRQIKDVNSPYRLMRSECLRAALRTIPPKSFAPNILITAWFVLKQKRIFTTTVEVREACAPRLSKMNKYFLKGSVNAALQTILFRLKFMIGKKYQ